MLSYAYLLALNIFGLQMEEGKTPTPFPLNPRTHRPQCFCNFAYKYLLPCKHMFLLHMWIQLGRDLPEVRAGDPLQVCVCVCVCVCV